MLERGRPAIQAPAEGRHGPQAPTGALLVHQTTSPWTRKR